MKPGDTMDACRRSHRLLLDDLAPLTDRDFRAPSLLPRYSRGHVVTHIANKARAHVLIIGGPAAGEVRRLHPKGYDPDLAADSGASRTAANLRSDLAQAFDLLEGAWDALEDALWDRQGTMMAGPRSMAEIVGHHLRNVEVHHVDLDIGYHPSDWPEIFIERELARRIRSFPDRAEHAEILAWFLGRGPAPALKGPW
jgi:maleylpyruvate isomerase